MYRTDFGTLWEKVRVGCFERTASKHVYYLGWNRSLAQVGCMRQVLGAGTLGRPRGMGWGGRREGGSGWGTHVNPWLIHANVWQKPLQYCKVISLQVIKINEKNKIKCCHCLPGGGCLVDKGGKIGGQDNCYSKAKRYDEFIHSGALDYPGLPISWWSQGRLPRGSVSWAEARKSGNKGSSAVL